MRVGLYLLSAVFATAPAFAQPSDAPLPACSDAANCPLIDYTRRTLGPGVDGITLSPSGSPGLLLARTNDPALANFRLIWLDQEPPIAPDRAASAFMQGLARPGRFCNHRPVAAPDLPSNTRAFDLRCAAGGVPEVQVWLLATQTPTRTRVVAFLAPLDNGPALLARGNRILGSFPGSTAASPPLVASQYQPPSNYDQLRADCADDANAPRQIAGCNAVLANPAEHNNYAIAINNRGHALERSGNAAAALQDYERALQRDPNYSTAHNNRARILAGMGRIDDALAALDRSIAIEDNIWTRLDRARIFVQRRETDRALAELTLAIAREARFADALIERGRLVAARGDHQSALKDFEAALAAEPNNAEARDGRDKARASIAAASAPSSTHMASSAPAGGGAQVQTVRSLVGDKPFSLSFPTGLERMDGSDAEISLNHPTELLQVTLKIVQADAGANARDASRSPAASVGREDRKAFPDFALEQRSLVSLPAGPAHLYVASMTSRIGDRPRLRLIVAEVFSEGRKYELSFIVGESVAESARNLIGFMLANLTTTNSPRDCCAEPIALPW